MGRKKKPRSPTPSHPPEALAATSGDWPVVREQINGEWCEGFEVRHAQTGTRVMWVGDEVVLHHWWYHPAYDEAPNTDVRRFRVADVLRGQGQREVLLTLGADAFEHLLALCHARRPDVPVVNIRHTPAPADPSPAATCGRSVRAALAPAVDRVVDRLSAGCNGCVALVVVMVLSTLLWLTPSFAWWWHGRVWGDLHAVSAVVVQHDLHVAQRNIGGGHKQPPKGVTHVYTPIIGFEADAVAGRVLNRAWQGWPTQDTRAQAQAWMQGHHPLGQSVTLWVLPGEALTAETAFVLSPDHTPSLWGLLGEAVVKLLLVTFVYVPLFLVALLLFGVAVSEGMSWWSRHRASSQG